MQGGGKSGSPSFYSTPTFFLYLFSQLTGRVGYWMTGWVWGGVCEGVNVVVGRWWADE